MHFMLYCQSCDNKIQLHNSDKVTLPSKTLSLSPNSLLFTNSRKCGTGGFGSFIYTATTAFTVIIINQKTKKTLENSHKWCQESCRETVDPHLTAYSRWKMERVKEVSEGPVLFVECLDTDCVTRRNQCHFFINRPSTKKLTLHNVETLNSHLLILSPVISLIITQTSLKPHLSSPSSPPTTPSSLPPACGLSAG